MPSNLNRGDVAIVSYETDQTAGAASPDALRFVLLQPITAGTVIYFTDRAWNGTAFAAGGGGDGTFTYSAPSNLAAGSVITLSGAALATGSITLSNGGETIYVYQGTDANTPTSFLFAADIADGNTTFNGILTGTGLTAGANAVAIAGDNASYQGSSTQLPQSQLIDISNNTHWHSSDQDDIGGTTGYSEVIDTTVTSPQTNSDLVIIAAMAGGGQSDAILRIGNDEGANVGSNLTRLFQDNVAFNHLSDVSFDLDNGFFFAVDSDGNNINRIIRGNVADLVSGNNNPAFTQVFATDGLSNGAGTAAPGEIIVNMEINTATNKIYWMDGNLTGDFEGGFQLWEANYDGSGMRLIQTIDTENPDPVVGFPGGVGDFAVDNARNFAYVSASTAGIDGLGNATVYQNHILQIDLTTGAVRFLNLGASPAGYHAGRLDPVQGQVIGIDVDQRDGTVYFVTQPISANDHGGVFKYTPGAIAGDVVGGTLAELWDQPTNNAYNTLQTFPTSNLTHIEFDEIGNRYYVSATSDADTENDGTPGTNEDDAAIFIGNPAGGAPTLFQRVYEPTANGAPQGLELDYAPVNTVTGAGTTYTETAGSPSAAGAAIAVFTGAAVTDPDGSIIQGASIAISGGFVSGDQLSFTAGGGITGSYNATGLLTLTGAASFAQYQAAINSVRFTNAGDNPTNYGNNPSRVISVTTFDGLANSDPASATIAVVGVNDAPVNTLPGTQAGTEDTSIVFTGGTRLSVTDVDADPAAQALQVTLSVAHGTLTLAGTAGLTFTAGDGTADPTLTFTGTANAINAALTSLTYIPLADYNGPDTLAFTTSDQGFNGVGGSLTDSDTISITLNAAVDIANDTATTNEDTQASIPVQLNDSFENPGHAITSVTQGAHGFVAINDNGTAGNFADDYLTYNPVADYNGPDSFTYTVTSGGVTETATVTVTVTAVADIVADSATTAEDTAVNVPVQLNDTFENTGHVITANSQGAHGSVALNNNNTTGDATDDYLVYTPAADYNGPDSFTYTVTSGGVTETTTVSVTVSAVTDIANDSFTVNGTLGAATLNVLLNDSFEAANPVITAVSTPSHGTVTIIDGPDADGINDYVSYTAAAGYAGPDSFTYTVTSGGVTETATVNLTVIVANAAPTSTNLAGDTAAYIEQAPPVRLDVGGNATIADVNSTDFAGGTLTVAITANGVSGEDVLGINQTAGVTTSGSNVLVGATVIGTYSGGTGGTPLAFALNANATPSTVQSLVRSLEYSNTNTLTPSTATRGVTVTLNDGDGTADGGTDTLIVTTSVTVTGVNDAPAGTDKTITTAEDTPTFIVASDFGFSDPENNNFVSVHIASLPATGTLQYDADGAGAGVPVAAAIGDYSVTGNARFVYTPALNANGTGIAGFGFQVIDDGGTANGGVNTDQSANTISFNVTPVNDAPTATNLNTAQTYIEDTTLNLADIVVTDVDSANVTATLTLSNAAAGALSVGTSGAVTATYNAGTGVWTASGATADVNALLEGVSFVPAANFNASITIATSVSDGTAPAVTGSIALTGTPVNDAPSGTDKTITIVEDTPVFITASDFGFSDPLDGNAFVTVHISSLPATGTLQYDADGAGAGVPVAAAIGDYSITGNARFIYTPALNANGTGIAGFGFQVIDNGGTTNGGQNTDQSANTISFDVTAVNDAPVNTVPGAQSVNEDAPLVFSSANGNAITVADVDAGGGNVTVVLAIADGALTLGGTSGIASSGNGTAMVTVTGTLANVNASLNGLTYAAPANSNGSRTLTIGTSDLGNAGSGGAQSDTDTVAITVNPINDAPIVPNSPTITATEQTAIVLNAALSVSDVDLDARNGGAGDYGGATFLINQGAAAASDVFSFAASSGFTVSGGNLQAGGLTFATVSQSGGVLNINFTSSGTAATTALVNDVLDHLQYTNTLDAPPASVDLIYGLIDGAPGGGQGTVVGGNSFDGGQITVNLTAVNDAPTATIGAIATATEQTALSLKGALSVADVDAGTGTVTATLSADYGQITVAAGGSGATVANSGTGSVTITGTLAQVNALLNTDGTSAVNYTANTDAPPASATLTLGINDGGNTGTGGSLTGSATHVITITPINDAPVGANAAVTGSEDDPYVFLTSDFPFTDAEGNALSAVVITTLPSIGVLRLGGSPVAAGTAVTLAQLQAGSLTYQGATDGFGSPYASFTFQVRDNGGTANGGQNTDQSPNTLTINLTPDNVAPVVDLNGANPGIDSTRSYTEGGNPARLGMNIDVSDFNQPTGDRIESVTVTITNAVAGDTLSVNGSLPSGISVSTVNTGSQVILTLSGAGTGNAYSNALQQIRYSSVSEDPAGDNPAGPGPTPSRTITVVANDGDLDSAVATATITVISVDDSPSARGDSFATTEVTVISGDLFADNGSGADFDVDSPTFSIVSVNGVSGSVGHQITLASGALLTVQSNGTFVYDPNGAFQYVPTAGSGASNFPGTDSFTYQLSGGDSATVIFSIVGIDNNDLLIGTASANVLFGGAGNDVLNGLGGNDLLIGGVGADTADGGMGDDTYVVDNAGDVVTEQTGGGYDIVYAEASYTLTPGAVVELLSTRINAGTEAINLTGNATTQNIVGNYGDNVLIGGGGADTLIGLYGNDTYAVTDANTAVIEQAGGGYDVVYSDVTYTLTAGSEVEVLSTRNNAGTEAIGLTGNAYDQAIVGNYGNNLLIGGGGADTLIGLQGDDVYALSNANVHVVEQAGGGTDIVYAEVSYTLDAGTSVEILSTRINAGTEAINLTGNGIAQTIVGNYGDNVLIGGGGADTLIGLYGNDTYAVADANAVIVEQAGGGNDLVYADVSYVLSAGASVEVLSTRINGATDAINLTGNDIGQVIIGNYGANVINGGLGADTLIGLQGADTFAFSTALGGGNVDAIADFQAGTDRISLDHGVFTGLGLGTLSADAFVAGTAALDANDRILYDRATGSLYFDADGNGAGAAILFATVTANTDLTAASLTVV